VVGGRKRLEPTSELFLNLGLAFLSVRRSVYIVLTGHGGSEPLVSTTFEEIRVSETFND